MEPQVSLYLTSKGCVLPLWLEDSVSCCGQSCSRAMGRTGVSAAASVQEYGGGTTRTWGLPEAVLRLGLCTPVVPGRFSDIIGKTSRGHLNGGRDVFPSKQLLCYTGISIDRTQLLTLASINYELWSAIAYSQWSSLREEALNLWILNLGSYSEDVGSTPTVSAHMTLAYFITLVPPNTETSQNSDSEPIKSTAGYLWSTA